MNAKKDLEQWVQQNRELKTVDERQVFYEKITATLDAQTSDARLTGLLALKDFVSKQRASLDLKLSKEVSPSIRVFPTSEEDRAFLQSLFFRMNIPFELTT
jgi:hypothetical protein